MCGIALIVSGLRIRFLFDSPPPNLDLFTSNGAVLTVEDFKSVLQRRGPDSLSTAKLILQFSQNEPDLLLSSSLHGAVFETPPLDFSSAVAELLFIGSTLQLRGLRPVTQPFRDSSGNILVFNGEIFGGIDVGSDGNDGEVLLQTLESCCSCMLHDDHTSVCSHDSVLDVLSAIRGPWAIVYWQERSKTLWFGRDAFGRRSLLVHWPCLRDSRFMLSSVSPVSSFEQSSELTVENGINTNFWEELPCGVYSLSIDARNAHGHVVGKMQKHEWANQMLVELIKWDRISIEPKNDDLKLPRCKIAMWQPSMQSASLPLETGLDHAPVFLPALNVLTALRKAVMLRSVSQNIFQPVKCSSQEELVPVAVLFSGGLDSMILAALLDQCLDAKYGIDLLNVSFDGQSAPDRISALSGLEELRRIAPARRWKLVEIDADLSKIGLKMKHVTSLINPANTYMDLNIGTALWLASSAEGWVYEGTEHSNDEKPGYIRYKSTARIILVGSGADEQCAGYGRHRTKYRSGSWHALYEEMKLDMQRIWKRNMGRDDRCISDNGKEARFPFLDEDVIKTLLDIPLWEVANLDQPIGTGDKKILREVAQMLGLCEASALPKRAIQFGSRIARESNRKNFGSNRAANQASAGSVLINMQ